MAERRGGGRKHGPLRTVSHAVREALQVKLTTPEGKAEMARRTGLDRTTLGRIADNKINETSKLPELHAALGMPPPEMSLDARLYKAFSTVLRYNEDFAEKLVVQVEQASADFEEAARQELAASEAKERAAHAKRRALARTVPDRDRPH
jgi:hypothetical protein